MRFSLIAAAMALATPAIGQGFAATQFNGYSVTLVGPSGIQMKPPSEEIIALADKACESAGKTAEYASSRYLNQGVGEYFFLCL